MTEATRSAELDASVDEVWEVLGDFGAISGWASNIDHSCLISEQVEGVGTVRRIQAGRTTVIERVTGWDPPSSLSYEIEGLPLVRSVTNTWAIEPRGTGSRVSLTSRVDAGPRPPQKLISAALARGMARASKVILAGLKERLA